MRRLPRSFVDPWDAWLQAAVEASREQLGEDWLSAYLTGPIWRFALSAGLCGEQAMTGVLMPNVDRVGRYFPLAIAVAVPEGCRPAMLPIAAADWFPAIEDLALSTLEEEFDFDRFDTLVGAARLPELPPPEIEPECETVAGNQPAGGRLIGWRLAGEPAAAYAALAERLLGVTAAPCSLWWTGGAEGIAPMTLVCRGMPPAGGFAVMLDGQWQRRGWAGAADLPAPPGAGPDQPWGDAG
jgi:type VI secretion system protein ImpM